MRIIDSSVLQGVSSFMDTPFGHGTDISTGWVLVMIVAFFAIWMVLSE